MQIVEPNGSSRVAGGEQSNGDLDPFQEEEEDDEFNEDEFSTAKENEARDPAPTLLPRRKLCRCARPCRSAARAAAATTPASTPGRWQNRF